MNPGTKPRKFTSAPAWRRLFVLAALCLWPLANVAVAWADQAPKIVKVGGYSFPPFVDQDQGVTLDLVNALNAYQNDYNFVIVPTSSRRRYSDLVDGRFDVIFFESVSWGWQTHMVDSSQVYLQGDGEVYVALAKPGRDKRFFADLNSRSLLGVTGYHYAFANYEGDPVMLQKKFTISFADDSNALMRMLSKERGEIAVVTKSFLQSYIAQHPELKGAFLISDKYDQRYQHTALVRKGAPLSAHDIDTLLDGMEKAGVLAKLWAKYGIK